MSPEPAPDCVVFTGVRFPSLRVLVLSFYYPPDLGPGPIRAKALVDAMIDEGSANLVVSVFTSTPNRYQSLRTEASLLEASEKLTVRRIPLPKHESGMLDQSRAFATFAQGVLREIQGRRWDIVVTTSSRLMTAVLGAWVAKRTRALLYLDIRDLFTDTMGDVLRGSPLRCLMPVFRLLERFALRSASRVNVVSAGFLPYLKKANPRGDYRLFTNGIDKEFLSEKFIMRDPQLNRPPLILYAGNMGEGQGLHYIIPEAARRLGDNARFRLIGDGGRRRELEAAVAQSGASNVEILDPVPRRELFDHYREAGILFLHLNDYEAFRKVLPSKIFEYAATGKPMLAGVAGYSASFLGSEVSGAEVFAPCDVDGMVAAFQRLIAGSSVLDRRDFCRRFARSKIMREMARDVLDLEPELGG